MTWWFVYLLTRVESFGIMFCLISVLTGIIGCILGLIYVVKGCDDGFNDKETIVLKPYIIKLVIISCITGCLTCFIPSTKEIAAIYLIPKIVNNEKCQAMPEKMMQLLNRKLDQWFEETINFDKNKTD